MFLSISKYCIDKLNPIVLKWGFFYIFFWVLLPIHAQKKMEKTWEASAFNTVEINTNDVSKIEVTTTTNTTISLIAIVAGEYAENLVLEISEANNKLILSTGYRPFFSPKNDKLAAHKVLSVEFQLKIPQNLSLKVISRLANLEITGALKNLKAKLQDGQILLSNFQGNAKLSTQEGDIICFVSKSTTGLGVSKWGQVKNELEEAGKFQVRASTVKGNISLYYSKE